MPSLHRNLRVVPGVMLVILAVSSCGSSGSGKSASTTTDAAPTTTTAAPTRPRATLEFREAHGQFFTSGPPCTLVAASTTTMNPTQAILFDRQRKMCYLVGPVLLTGKGIDQASVAYNPTNSQWAVVVQWVNDDFVTKVAEPLVNREVAIVVDDVVQSAPTLNPGITERYFEITDEFSRAEAIELAAALKGVEPSQISAEPDPN